MIMNYDNDNDYDYRDGDARESVRFLYHYVTPIMFDEFPTEVPANTLAQVSQGTSTPLKQFKGSSTLDRLAGTISC